MIRNATESDIPCVVEMARRFFEISGYTEAGKYDQRTTEATMRELISSESGILLVLGDLGGMAGALVYPFYMTGRLTAQELFWWVEPGNRGHGRKLLSALEEAVKTRGAESLSMIALAGLNPEKVGAVYRRAGYRASEHSYIKELYHGN